MDWSLDKIDKNVQHIYRVDILSAMCYFKKIWREIDDVIVRNFWHLNFIEADGCPVLQNISVEDDDMYNTSWI